MTEPHEFVPVYTAQGQLAGEMIRLLLESMDIPAIISQESAGITFGLTVGPMGEVKILVPANRVTEALEILKEMEEGKLESTNFPDAYPPERHYKENKIPPDEVLKDSD
jgi:hypothetical protein